MQTTRTSSLNPTMNTNSTNQDANRTLKIDLINLDASNSANFQSEILPLLEDPRPLILDMSTVQFADSSGLGVLCSLAKRARFDQLKFQGVSPRLSRVLCRVPSLEVLSHARPRLTVLTA